MLVIEIGLQSAPETFTTRFETPEWAAWIKPTVIIAMQRDIKNRRIVVKSSLCSIAYKTLANKSTVPNTTYHDERPFAAED